MHNSGKLPCLSMVTGLQLPLATVIALVAGNRPPPSWPSGCNLRQVPAIAPAHRVVSCARDPHPQNLESRTRPDHRIIRNNLPHLVALPPLPSQHPQRSSPSHCLQSFLPAALGFRRPTLQTPLCRGCAAVTSIMRHSVATWLTAATGLLMASTASARLDTPKHEPGRCAFRGHCGKQSFFGKELPCVDNEPAQDPDEELRKELVDLCGDKWATGPVCCELEQVSRVFVSIYGDFLTIK